MKPFFTTLLLLVLIGCTTAPTPTPQIILQYPATWTPAPTLTNTPPGPTATLVIQNTRGPLPTPDPNVRVLPSPADGTLGVWMDVTDPKAPNLEQVVPSAQILVSQQPAANLRQSNQSFWIETAVLPGVDAFGPATNGVILQDSALDNSSAIETLRDVIKPRLVLAKLPITDTARLEATDSNFDGIRLENFMRSAETPADQFPNESEWRRQVDTLASLSARRSIILTATRFPANVSTDTLDYGRWLKFAMASYLLGINNSHTFFGAPDAMAQQYIPAILPVESLGKPFGSYFKMNGVYQRRFANGLVLVNPGSETRAFFLPRSYRNSIGTVINEIKLEPYSGEFLFAAD